MVLSIRSSLLWHIPSIISLEYCISFVLFPVISSVTVLDDTFEHTVMLVCLNICIK
jgi:hypothetical protein